MSDHFIVGIEYQNSASEGLRTIYGRVKKRRLFSELDDFITVENEGSLTICKYDIKKIRIFRTRSTIAYAGQKKILCEVF